MTSTAKQPKTNAETNATVPVFPNDFPTYKAAVQRLVDLRQGLYGVEGRLRAHAAAESVVRSTIPARVEALLVGVATPGDVDEDDGPSADHLAKEQRRLRTEKRALEDAIRLQETAVSHEAQKAAKVVADAIRPEWRELANEIHDHILQLEALLCEEAKIHQDAAAKGLPLSSCLPRLAMSLSGAAWSWRHAAYEAGAMEMTYQEFCELLNKKEREYLDNQNIGGARGI
jgi:hypothetical protein